MTPARAQFREALDALRVDVDALGLLAEQAVVGALASLLGDDRSVALHVVAGDDRIDALFVALEERAYALVAQQAPVAADLRFLMSSLRVMADYEKTGDRAVALAKSTLAEWDREPATIALLGRMGDLALSLLASARIAWIEQDILVASELQRRDDVLDETFRCLIAHLLGPAGAGAPGLVLHAHAAGRNLERIADHAVIIGERVSYMLTGDPSALAAEIPVNGPARDPATTVLVVEDEESFVDALTIGLKREGFRVEVARDGVEALDRFNAVHPDLVLLDVMLPTLSGIEVCRQIRTHSRVPIIMVSAKTSEIDTVVGLEVGADDYVSKPYRMRELVARIRATLRRAPQPAEGSSRSVVEVGQVRLDAESHEVFVANKPVKLPLKEFELLEALLNNAGRVLTRNTLIDRVWGPSYVGDTKTLDVHIKRLRAKVEVDPGVPVAIVTIRGLGYKFELPAPSAAGA